MAEFNVEKIIQVWNSKSGDRVEVGPDSDGLDMVELKLYDAGKIHSRIVMPPEQAVLVAKAILELYSEKKV